MRRITACLGVLILVGALSGSASAVNPVIGAKAALNVASWHGDDVDDLLLDSGSRIGFGAGGYVEVPVTPTLSFQGEVLYMMKGATDSEANVDFTLKLSYFEIPLLLKLNVPRGSGMKFYFLGGPAIGIETSSKLKVEGGGASVEFDMSDVCLDTKSTDVGLVLGGGVELLPVSPKVRISLEARYTLGLSSINDSPAYCEGEYIGGPFDAKNGVVSFFIGFGI